MPTDQPAASPVIVVYPSGHGFGHAVRCAALCRALQAVACGPRIVVRTAAPAWIFPPGVEVMPGALDAGVVQPNSLEIDPRATLERYATLVADEPPRVEAEARWLRQLGARVVVADVPSAALASAALADLPGIALANFSWDWIYEPFVADLPGYAPLLAHLRAQYRQAALLLRLPFHDGLTAFPVVEDVPLIARRSTAPPEETRRRLGLPREAPLVLFSFGGHANGGPDPIRLARLADFAFVATGASPGRGAATARAGRDGRHTSVAQAVRQGLNLFVVPPLDDAYVDLLAACDAVVTKPGYGIVADVIANRVPALYVSRGGFREEPVLVRALEAEARALPLDRAALDALDLRPALTRLLALDRPWSERRQDGAEVAARRVLAEAGLG